MMEKVINCLVMNIKENPLALTMALFIVVLGIFIVHPDKLSQLLGTVGPYIDRFWVDDTGATKLTPMLGQTMLGLFVVGGTSGVYIGFRSERRRNIDRLSKVIDGNLELAKQVNMMREKIRRIEKETKISLRDFHVQGHGCKEVKKAMETYETAMFNAMLSAFETMKTRAVITIRDNTKLLLLEKGIKPAELKVYFKKAYYETGRERTISNLLVMNDAICASDHCPPTSPNDISRKVQGSTALEKSLGIERMFCVNDVSNRTEISGYHTNLNDEPKHAAKLVIPLYHQKDDPELRVDGFLCLVIDNSSKKKIFDKSKVDQDLIVKMWSTYATCFDMIYSDIYTACKRTVKNDMGDIIRSSEHCELSRLRALKKSSAEIDAFLQTSSLSSNLDRRSRMRMG